jgi:eukaryotic-like serine/threonine-protein kinase
MSYEIGTTVGDYQVVAVLGSGGMGKVYKVRNLISDRMEAMKVLLPNLSADQELAERFMREIKVQASLNHPNIASLHTAQRIDNQLLMIMEFVEGFTIEALMRQGRIPLPHAVDYAMQVLAALAYAHPRGVIHRDIKPANMMLTPQGVIKLMDFGIAKISDQHLTQTGKTVGSLFYMSPEQIRGDSHIDARSDLYSLGISLYEMATGRRPFEGESDYSIMAAHLQQQPPPPLQIDPSLPEALSDIILMSLAKDPGKRFQTADAFRAALGSAANQLGAGAAAGAAAGAPMFQGYAPPPSSAQTATLPKHPTAPTMQQVGLMYPPPQPQPSPTHPSQPRMGSMPPPPAPWQFQPMPPPPAQAPRGHRGLYMVIGSLVTVGVLVAAALYLPKLWKTGASEKAATTQVAQVTPSAQQPPSQTQRQQQPAAVPVTPTQASPKEPYPPPPTAPPSVTAPQVRVQNPQPPQKPPTRTPEPLHPQSTPPVVASPVPARPQPQPPVPQPQATMPQPHAPRTQPSSPPPSPDPIPNRQVDLNPSTPPIPQPRRQGYDRPSPGGGELDELKHQRDLMLPRIHVVNESMNNLREQNRQSGLGVSGDLVASQKRMGFYMDVVADALRNGNIAEARTSMINAERELNKLERRFNH